MLEPLTFPPPPGPPCDFGDPAEPAYDKALSAALSTAVWVQPPPRPGSDRQPGPACVWEVLDREEAQTWVVPLAETG